LDAVGLAGDHFSAGEARAVAAQKNPAAQRDLFFRLWTAKEAALKTTGRGVYDGLDEPDLAFAIDQLRADGAVLAFSASSRLPGGRRATRRIADRNGGEAYLARAIADAP